MRQCLFSIVIAPGGEPGALEKTLDSALRQSLEDRQYEIILTAPEAGECAARLAAGRENVRPLELGPAATLGEAWNRGLAEAAGDYLLFLQSGNCLTSDALEFFSLATQKSAPDMVYSHERAVSAQGEGLFFAPGKREGADDLFEAVLGGSFGWPYSVGGAACRRDFLQKNNIKFARLNQGAEILFSVACALRAGQVAGLDELTHYRVAPAAAVSAESLKARIDDSVHAFAGLLNFLEKAGAPERAVKNRELFQNGLAAYYLLLLQQALSAHSWNTVRSLLRNAFQASRSFAAEAGIFAALEKSLAASQERAKGPALAASLQKAAVAAAGAVVMVADINAHVRHFAGIARQLQHLGRKCALFDLSGSAMGGKRKLEKSEIAALSDIAYFQMDPLYSFPFFPNARAYLTALDWGGLFKPLRVGLRERGVPLVLFYEGINDDTLAEKAPGKMTYPYRNGDLLLLPGEYYRGIYAKQNSVVCGLPYLRALLGEEVRVPEKPRVVINVNFSYGVLEDKRPLFTLTAVEACRKLGLDFVLSQHPIDSGKFDGLPVSKQGIYDEIRQGSILVSRFSTCIMEALALGKPAVYHNPHGERFPKFVEDPMGAYEISDSAESLAAIIEAELARQARGEDIRARARPFLQYHSNIFADEAPEYYAAKSIDSFMAEREESFLQRVMYLAGQSPAAQLRQEPV